MEDKVRFIPQIVDYPERISRRVLTDEESKLIDESRKRMIALVEKYNVHVVMNNYIYLPVYKNGVRIDKSFRIKVDGPIYKQIVDGCGGELPRHIHIEEAEKLDIDEIY